MVPHSRRAVLQGALVGLTGIGAGCIEGTEPSGSTASSGTTSPTPSSGPGETKGKTAQTSPTASPDSGETRGTTAQSGQVEDLQLSNQTERTITVTITVTGKSSETVFSKAVTLNPPDQWVQAEAFATREAHTLEVDVEEGPTKSRELAPADGVYITVYESKIRIREIVAEDH